MGIRMMYQHCYSSSCFSLFSTPSTLIWLYREPKPGSRLFTLWHFKLWPNLLPLSHHSTHFSSAGTVSELILVIFRLVLIIPVKGQIFKAEVSTAHEAFTIHEYHLLVGFLGSPLTELEGMVQLDVKLSKR